MEEKNGIYIFFNDLKYLKNLVLNFYINFSRPRWRLGNKELSQLWKWADQNPVREI